jgi:3-isopropylmalate dehydrogenase
MMFEDAFGLKEEAEAIRTVVKSLEQGIVTGNKVKHTKSEV